MADKVAEKIENEVCIKKKDVVESPVKEKKDEKSEKENGDVCEGENGSHAEAEDKVDAKGTGDVVCPVKRKSGAGGDKAEDKTAEEVVTPEKKAKLDEPSVEAESNGEAEVAA